MLQPESPNYPHNLWQWLYIVIAAFLASGGTWLGLWSRRKHAPAEVRKIDAETRSILVRDDIALGDSVARLIKEVSQAALDAERRRQEWLLHEERMRGQISFWREKAEGLDGELIDSRDSNVQLKARIKIKQDALDKCMALIAYHKVPFAEADEPHIKELIDILRKQVERSRE